MANEIPKNSAEAFSFPGGKTGILLIHGFTGTPYIFRGIGETLAKHGYTVVAPLLAGHGTTPDDMAKTNWHDWYDSIETAYDLLAKKCSSIVVVGASFGGNLCCRLSTRRPITALILIGMPRWIYRHNLGKIWAAILRLTGQKYFNKGLGKKMHEDVLLGGPNYSYLKIPLTSVHEVYEVMDVLTDEVIGIVKVPTLIIQSDNDGLVRPKSGQYIFENLGAETKELIWIDEPHHELHNGKNRQRIFNYVINFISREKN